MTDLSEPIAKPEHEGAPIAPPLWLLAELTYRCPLHCVFCYNPVNYADHTRELDGLLLIAPAVPLVLDDEVGPETLPHGQHGQRGEGRE